MCGLSAAARPTSHQLVHAWMTAGICQACSSARPFQPNIRKVLIRANTSVTRKRMWQRFPSSTDNFWQVRGTHYLPLETAARWQQPSFVTYDGAPRLPTGNHLVKQSRNENWVACQFKRQKVGAGRTQESKGRCGATPAGALLYLVALKNQLQTRSCWRGWNCSPQHLTQGCTDGRHTTHMGWTCEKKKTTLRTVNTQTSQTIHHLAWRQNQKRGSGVVLLPLLLWHGTPAAFTGSTCTAATATF